MQLFFCIFLHYLLLPTFSKQIEIQCPKHCKCDIFEKLRRAICTNRNVGKVEANIPPQTQLLDLSFNQITLLNDKVFQEEKLVALKLLNISHNKIGEIHMNAFQGLKQLKTLDLSYNVIQYIIRNWFFSLESLEELYLKGNSFSKLNSGPLFASNSLKRLDLSECGTSFIATDSFAEIPNLEFLDVSANYLIHFKVETIVPLRSLNTLNVSFTSIKCDNVYQELSDFCQKKGVRFLHPCKKIKSLDSDMFERMVNLEEVDEKNSWMYEEIESDNETKTIVACNNTREDKSLLQEVVDLSPGLSIFFPFLYGFACGVLAAYILQICRERKKNTSESTYFSFEDSDSHLHRRRGSRRFRRSYSTDRARDREESQHLPLREWKLSESTPVLYRKNLNSFS